MTEWQPIETAPKDGTPILIYGSNGRGVKQMTTALWDRDSEELGKWKLCVADGWECEEFLKREPTHWQSLPAPPKP